MNHAADPMLLVLVRRLGNVIPTLLAVIALVFLLFSVLPGSFISGMNEDGRSVIDPAVMERMRKEMGLDDPLPSASSTTSASWPRAISARPSAPASR